jgi:HD-like signal output (HDOD) protein
MAIPAPETQKELGRALAPAEFLKALSTELANGDVRLPSFPDIAQRVQRALEDPRATPEQVARVVGIDAALAARILRLSNSAFLSSAKPITELQQAVKRLGHQMVRCSAVSFALQQMIAAGNIAALRPQLHELWRKGTLVASIAYVFARETRAANPDEALVAGLMHNIGSLYITVRAHQHGAPSSATDDAATRVLNNGHPRIAAAILGHWKFAPAIVSAVGNQNATDLPASGAGPLTDLLIVSISLVPCVFYRALLDETVSGVAAFQRLALDAAECKRLLSSAARQIKALQSALAS